MQEVLSLDPDKPLDGAGYQINVTEDCEFFTCKAIAAGANIISKDILKMHGGTLLPADMPKAMEELEVRVRLLLDNVRDEVGSVYCQQILGFDPMKYEEYPEQIQEQIELGEWMKTCARAIGTTVDTVIKQFEQSKYICFDSLKDDWCRGAQETINIIEPIEKC